MLTITPLVYVSKFLLSFAADGLDENRLQLERNGQFFQVLPAYFGEIAKKKYSYFFFIGETR